MPELLDALVAGLIEHGIVVLLLVAGIGLLYWRQVVTGAEMKELKERDREELERLRAYCATETARLRDEIAMWRSMVVKDKS